MHLQHFHLFLVYSLFDPLVCYNQVAIDYQMGTDGLTMNGAWVFPTAGDSLGAVWLVVSMKYVPETLEAQKNHPTLGDMERTV